MRGIIDSFIKAQLEELDESKKPILTDKLIYSLIMDFVLGGESSDTFSGTWRSRQPYIAPSSKIPRIEAKLRFTI